MLNYFQTATLLLSIALLNGCASQPEPKKADDQSTKANYEDFLCDTHLDPPPVPGPTKSIIHPRKKEW